MKRLLAALKEELELLAMLLRLCGVPLPAPRRKPAAPAREPLPGVSEDQSGLVARLKWRMPTPQELDYARACTTSHPSPHANATFICRGPLKGCVRDTQDNCPDCYRVFWHDRRSSDEILQAMERGDA